MISPSFPKAAALKSDARGPPGDDFRFARLSSFADGVLEAIGCARRGCLRGKATLPLVVKYPSSFTTNSVINIPIIRLFQP